MRTLCALQSVGSERERVRGVEAAGLQASRRRRVTRHCGTCTAAHHARPLPAWPPVHLGSHHMRGAATIHVALRDQMKERPTRLDCWCPNSSTADAASARPAPSRVSSSSEAHSASRLSGVMASTSSGDGCGWGGGSAGAGLCRGRRARAAAAVALRSEAAALRASPAPPGQPAPRAPHLRPAPQPGQQVELGGQRGGQQRRLLGRIVEHLRAQVPRRHVPHLARQLPRAGARQVSGGQQHRRHVAPPLLQEAQEDGVLGQQQQQRRQQQHRRRVAARDLRAGWREQRRRRSGGCAPALARGCPQRRGLSRSCLQAHPQQPGPPPPPPPPPVAQAPLQRPTHRPPIRSGAPTRPPGS